METIPLPRTRAEEKRPIHVRFTPDAFPGHRFAVRMDWNNQLGPNGKWTIEIEHLDAERQATKSTATPYRVYPYLPWVVFFFADLSGQQMEVTPWNLGDEMQLYAVPGPGGDV